MPKLIGMRSQCGRLFGMRPAMLALPRSLWCYGCLSEKPCGVVACLEAEFSAAGNVKGSVGFPFQEENYTQCNNRHRYNLLKQSIQAGV